MAKNIFNDMLTWMTIFCKTYQLTKHERYITTNITIFLLYFSRWHSWNVLILQQWYSVQLSKKNEIKTLIINGWQNNRYFLVHNTILKNLTVVRESALSSLDIHRQVKRNLLSLQHCPTSGGRLDRKRDTASYLD